MWMRMLTVDDAAGSRRCRVATCRIPVNIQEQVPSLGIAVSRTTVAAIELLCQFWDWLTSTHGRPIVDVFSRVITTAAAPDIVLCMHRAKLFFLTVDRSRTLNIHCVHEKNYNPVYVATTLANNVGF